jgi:hypothetical protein
MNSSEGGCFFEPRQVPWFDVAPILSWDTFYSECRREPVDPEELVS